MQLSETLERTVAERRLREALRLNSRDEQAWLELGDLFANSGQYGPADRAYRSGLSVSRFRAPFCVRLARISLLVGRASEAAELLHQAILLLRPSGLARPPTAANQELLGEAMELVGRMRLREGKLPQALGCFQEAVELGGKASAKAQFAACLGRLRFIRPEGQIKPIFVSAIEEAWIHPALLMQSAASLLLHEPGFNISPEDKHGSAAHELSRPSIQEAANDPLLAAMLRFGIITNPVLEQFLVKTRRQLLTVVTADPYAVDRNDWIRFCAALACQCYANDYAYPWEEDETNNVEVLIDRLEGKLVALPGAGELEAAIVACYRPLHCLSPARCVPAQNWSEPMRELVIRQIAESDREIEIRETIPRLGSINGAVTRAVQRQYEENPYPSWSKLPLQPVSRRLENTLRAILPPDIAARESFVEPKTILVAGCGTGQESVALALQFNDASLLAIDLSLKSLGYAQRKSEEHGAVNVRYVQADLFQLNEIGIQFDLVVCAGVLHHLEKPFDGLEQLARMTRPGGHLMIALYSRLGRQDIEPLSAFARTNGFEPTSGGLRSFRDAVLRRDPTDPVRANAVARDDFYSLNMLRDMVFHVSERCVDISDIAEAISRLRLEFRGFLLEDHDVRNRFQSRFGADADLLSLDLWDQFEKENPQTFMAMYHFMLRK